MQAHDHNGIQPNHQMWQSVATSNSSRTVSYLVGVVPSAGAGEVHGGGVVSLSAVARRAAFAFEKVALLIISLDMATAETQAYERVLHHR